MFVTNDLQLPPLSTDDPHSHRYKIGHLAPTWNVRLKAKPVFEEIWGTNELLTSFDAVIICRPPEESEEKFYSSNSGWLHINQGVGRLGLHAYPGAVYLEDADNDDWVFEALDSSHAFFEDFFEAFTAERQESLKSDDYMRLEDHHISWFRERGCIRKRVPVPRGAILLWDSRLVHGSARPMQGRKHPGRWRWAVIVCMTPAAWADKESIRLKKKAYRELRMTSHWPSQAIRLLPENLPEKAACEKRPLKDLPLVAKTMEAMQLAGVVPYRKNLTRLLEKGASGALGGAAHRPRWSPDYQPPKDSFDPDNSWVGIAVFCGVVSLLSALVYGLVYASAK
ncbi:hypothetical protein C0Q70_03812 [Pomacea canaliculata]|uniref:Phytanoyl-CoA dioxygenase n=1 Tax=Pomacea canaliculata TaxID=400727 RepID=A0A2T7PTS3_POMCA|nr:hypothetical protein C0Q70_03812 [Pomacea canaliculata]